MFKKINCILILTMFFLIRTVFVKAQDNGWELNLKRTALNITTTQVRNADVYANFPDSRLRADTQTFIKALFNFEASYNEQKYLWINDIFAQYGRTTIKPVRGAQTKTENVNSIVLTSDIAYKMWKVEDPFGGFDVGPFANASYKTEFPHQNNTPRKKLISGRFGAKVFEGKYIKNLYTSIMFEEDFTYSNAYSANTAWESGLKLEHTIRDGVKASYGLLFRDYIKHSRELLINLDYELEASARMDVLVYKNLAIAPFINYYIAQGKYMAGLGQNLYIGISFSFSKILKAR